MSCREVTVSTNQYMSLAPSGPSPPHVNPVRFLARLLAALRAAATAVLAPGVQPCRADPSRHGLEGQIPKSMVRAETRLATMPLRQSRPAGRR